MNQGTMNVRSMAATSWNGSTPMDGTVPAKAYAAHCAVHAMARPMPVKSM